MAVARSWRAPERLDGPYPMDAGDVESLNMVFSDAFTDRYRKDGLIGVRVPHLQEAIWRYAIADAGSGAMLWRGERGEVAAFNMAHASGAEGWMGPLAVHPDYQGTGHGTTIVRAGIDWLRAGGARTIGLETMPRTMDNIGFYSRLGFDPAFLTVTLTLDARHNDHPFVLLDRLTPAAQDDQLEAIGALVGGLAPGVDFSREIRLTQSIGLGDTILLHAGDTLLGFALCHTVPLIDGRAREETRVLKLGVSASADLPLLLDALGEYARRSGTHRVAIRVQGVYRAAYAMLIARGARVRWTDLRMTLAGHAERDVSGGIVLSNWEI